MDKDQLSAQILCQMAASQAIEDEIDLYMIFLNGDFDMLPVAGRLHNPVLRQVQMIDARAEATWRPPSPSSPRSVPKRQRT